VNGRVVGHAWLNPGDVLQLCDTQFVVTCDDDAPADPPAEPGGWGTGHWAG
jgi:hypothetical protein